MAEPVEKVLKNLDIISDCENTYDSEQEVQNSNDTLALDNLFQRPNRNHNLIDMCRSSLLIKFDPLYRISSPLVYYELPNKTDAPNAVSSPSASDIFSSDKEPLASISENIPPTAISSNFLSDDIVEDRHLASLKTVLEKLEWVNKKLYQENMEIKHYEWINEDLNDKLRILEEEKNGWSDREFKLMEAIKKKDISNKNMDSVMEEYEKTITFLTDKQLEEKLHHEKLLKQVFAERDELVPHIVCIKNSYDDLLIKYEKSKTVVLNLNEKVKAVYQKILDCEEIRKANVNKYNEVKRTTSEILNKANETFHNYNIAHHQEIEKLNAIKKKSEVKITSLESLLAQKSKEYEELTIIFDQFIKDFDKPST